MIQYDLIFGIFYKTNVLLTSLRMIKHDDALTAVLHIFGYFLLTLFFISFSFPHLYVE